MKHQATMTRRISSMYPILALVLITLSLHRIYIATVGLSRSISYGDGASFDAYQAEFFPRPSDRAPLDAKIRPSDRAPLDAKIRPSDRAPLDAKTAPYRRVPPTLSNLRTFDESKLPFKCGLVFFYHIACTGGASMNRFFWKLKDHHENTTYWQHWGRHDGVQDTFIRGMEEQVKDIKEGEWRLVHAHGFSLFPNSSEPYLYRWREEVEGQGCGFVATTMLRDAVGHTISQTKGMINPNLTLDEFVDHLEPENYNQRGIFNTQIDYLVYNRGPRNEYGVTKEEKVRRAMELLQRHFDIVLLSDYQRFQDIILRVTGMGRVHMGKGNTFNGELNYTERELNKIKTLTEANGDVLFIDAVKHVYYGHLDYLLA